MPLYDVTWEIEVDAESHEEAAQEALKIQRDPTSEATHFTVFHSEMGGAEHVELNNSEFKTQAEIRAETAEQCLTRIDQFATEKQDCMRQIADAMERNPEGWWLEFEFLANNGVWCQTHSQAAVFMHLQQTSIRPKPRTYTLHIEDMPEPLREEPNFREPYYVLRLSRPIRTIWVGTDSDFRKLKEGRCYSDEQTARQALEKLTRAMGGGE